MPFFSAMIAVITPENSEWIRDKFKYGVEEPFHNTSMANMEQTGQREMMTMMMVIMRTDDDNENNDIDEDTRAEVVGRHG